MSELQQRQERARGRAIDAGTHFDSLRNDFKAAERIARRLPRLGARADSLVASLRLRVGEAELIAADLWRAAREIGAEPADEVPAAIARYVDRLNEAERQWKTPTGTLDEPPRRFFLDGGGKVYARIAVQVVGIDGEDAPGGKSVHVFVSKRDGTILKAKGHGGPDTRRPRGNVFQLPECKRGCLDPIRLMGR